VFRSGGTKPLAHRDAEPNAIPGAKSNTVSDVEPHAVHGQGVLEPDPEPYRQPFPQPFPQSEPVSEPHVQSTRRAASFGNNPGGMPRRG
jgi:hypothetical protein